MLNHFLLLITPGKGASLLAVALALASFLLGFLEMLTRDIEAASTHMNLSLGIMAGLMLLKYLSLRATNQIADDAQARIRQHIIRRAQPPAGTAPQAAEGAPAMTEAQLRAQERADMQELSIQLRSALDSIHPDSPIRPKYEATVEWIERVMQREA